MQRRNNKREAAELAARLLAEKNQIFQAAHQQQAQSPTRYFKKPPVLLFIAFLKIKMRFFSHFSKNLRKLLLAFSKNFQS